MRRTLNWAAICLAATTIIGCQANPTPTTPPSNTSMDTHIPISTPDQGWVGVAAVDLDIDKTSMQATVTPVRLGSAVGDTYSELGLAPGFTELFGRHLSVAALRMSGPNTVEVDLTVDHPFSAAIRPDLAIFNLKCYVVTDAPQVLAIDGEGLAPGILGNADGYGQMWSLTADSLPTFMPASLQPYIILREDPTAGTFNFASPAGYNVFFPGQASVDTLSLNIGNSTSFNARLYLTADYGQSAVRATRQTPAYELPKFAGNAPWKVQITELTNDLQGGVASSTATFQVDIWDWKHGQSLGSDVASATLEIPGVTSSPLNLVLSGTGTDPTPLTASTLVLNSLAAVGGDYWAVVKVTDSATGTGLKEDLSTPITLSSYVTYAVAPVNVSAVATPPIAALSIDNCNPAAIRIGLDAICDASASTPTTHPIASYEWDFDYDGVTFTPETTGNRAWRTSVTAGTYTVAVRVSDTFTNSSIATAPVTVVAPAAAWQTPVRITTNTRDEILGNQSDDTLIPAPNGDVHMLSLGLQGSSTRILQHAIYDACANTWSPVTDVATTGAPFSSQPAGICTSDGTLHAFSQGPGMVIEHRTYNGSWSGPTTVITPPAGTMSSSFGLEMVATDKTDTDVVGVTAPYRMLQPCTGTPSIPHNIVFAARTTGVWGPQSIIATQDVITDIGGCSGSVLSYFPAYIDLASMANNEWMVVYQTLVNPYMGTPVTVQDMRLDYARTVSNVWQPAGTAYNTGRAMSVKMARSPNGTLWTVAWTPPVFPFWLSISQYDGATWTSPVQVLAPSGQPTPQIGFTDSGRGVIWGASISGSTIQLKRFKETDTPAFIAGLAVEQPQGAVAWSRFHGGAHVLDDGRIMAIWKSQQFGSGPSSELEAAIWQ